MGKKILPYIEEAYSEKEGEDSILTLHGLVALVQDVAGESFRIPEHLRGNMIKIRNYTYNWLDAN